MNLHTNDYIFLSRSRGFAKKLWNQTERIGCQLRGETQPSPGLSPLLLILNLTFPKLLGQPCCYMILGGEGRNGDGN